MILPEIKRIPEGATKEDRIKMFNDYKKLLAALNPGHFHANGEHKKWWRFWA